MAHYPNAAADFLHKEIYIDPCHLPQSSNLSLGGASAQLLTLEIYIDPCYLPQSSNLSLGYLPRSSNHASEVGAFAFPVFTISLHIFCSFHAKN
ncbi:hypothetical protein V6N13_145626 [Hibiscus sabdariffa]